ncbi:MAG: hypothetical protein ABI082_08925, partial [Dokdonella sp.]
GASDDTLLTYFATVTIQRNGAGEGFWNEETGASHAHTPLGALHRNGWCWENETAKVCASKLTEEHPTATSSLSQTETSAMGGGVRLTDAENSTPPCPAGPESQRWSSADNEHGVVMAANDGEKLYIGTSCDVVSSRFGSGRWASSNAGVRFQFDTCYVGWPRAEPPIETSDCELTF